MARRGGNGHRPEASGVAARAFWSGTITFGLVSIPVDLLTATRPSRVRLRMLDAEGNPLRREYYCPEDDEAVGFDAIVRGYQLDDGGFVEVTDDELESLAPEKSRDIDLRRFVDVSQIDPMYFRRGYFLAPAGESTKAYHLLARTMEETGRAGIATFVMRGKEYLVAILAEGGVLRAETMRFANELRTPETIGLPEQDAPDAAAVRRITRAIRAMSAGEIDLDELSDEASERLLALIERKRAEGTDVVELEPEAPEEEEEGPAEVVDLMQLLKQRVGTPAGDGGRRAGPRRAPPAALAAELESQSKDELYERAKKLGIEGRSKMTKQQLVTAIRKSG